MHVYNKRKIIIFVILHDEVFITLTNSLNFNTFFYKKILSKTQL
jgi:hypothetical protein